MTFANAPGPRVEPTAFGGSWARALRQRHQCKASQVDALP